MTRGVPSKEASPSHVSTLSLSLSKYPHIHIGKIRRHKQQHKSLKMIGSIRKLPVMHFVAPRIKYEQSAPAEHHFNVRRNQLDKFPPLLGDNLAMVITGGISKPPRATRGDAPKRRIGQGQGWAVDERMHVQLGFQNTPAGRRGEGEGGVQRPESTSIRSIVASHTDMLCAASLGMKAPVSVNVAALCPRAPS